MSFNKEEMRRCTPILEAGHNRMEHKSRLLIRLYFRICTHLLAAVVRLYLGNSTSTGTLHKDPCLFLAAPPTLYPQLDVDSWSPKSHPGPLQHVNQNAKKAGTRRVIVQIWYQYEWFKGPTSACNRGIPQFCYSR